MVTRNSFPYRLANLAHMLKEKRVLKSVLVASITNEGKQALETNQSLVKKALGAAIGY